MSLNDLRYQLKNYRDTLSEIKAFRKEWTASQALIFTTLTNIVEKLDINAEVLKGEKLEGLESIHFSFGDRESGVAVRSGKTKRPITKVSGQLIYTQLYNGRISVWIKLPIIEQLMESQTTAKPIDIYAPKDLKEANIIGHLNSFMQIMTNWERNSLAHHEVAAKYFLDKTES